MIPYCLKFVGVKCENLNDETYLCGPCPPKYTGNGQYCIGENSAQYIYFNNIGTMIIVKRGSKDWNGPSSQRNWQPGGYVPGGFLLPWGTL